ncbi:hypothetical protein [Halobacteriovorax sp. RT-2-6]|uniref:hypothetical protein n=1 Tax=unclassified Halobacteriovorax TaxID=2639665 RepID=UPI00399B2D65
MYESKRTRRNSKLYRKAGLCAFAGFTLISCTTNPKDLSDKAGASTNKVEAHKLLTSGICQEFKGRGRLKFGKNQERFTYNAILNKETFSLAIDVPFKGQETLILPLDASEELAADISGTLYKKISTELVKAKRYSSLKILNDFLLRNRLFFSEIKNIDSNYCDRGCLEGDIKHYSDGTVEYKTPMIGNYEFNASFSQLQENEYKFIRLEGIHNSKKTNKKQRVLALDLIVDSCGSI